MTLTTIFAMSNFSYSLETLSFLLMSFVYEDYTSDIKVFVSLVFVFNFSVTFLTVLALSAFTVLTVVL